MFETIQKAPLVDTEAGLVPDGDGWFIVSVADAAGLRSERFGDGCRFEGSTRFEELGFNIRVPQPGQPASLYHREAAAEAFLVIAGECVAIVEDLERPMRAGDFLHAPPGTAHVLVGARNGGCVIAMAGARKDSVELLYPESEIAARQGASAEVANSDPAAAYAGTPPPTAATVSATW